MIASTTAALGMSVARGLLKLGPRLDRLLAEKRAVQSGLILVMPSIYNGPDGVQKVEQLRAFLALPIATTAVLGAADRAELVAELAKPVPGNAVVGAFYQRLFPERLQLAPFKPDAAFVSKLRELLPSFDLSDPDQLAAAYTITAGKDDREIGYGGRIGLLVADVVAEFGAENTALFVRDPGLRSVAQAVLERFAKPDLETFTQWSPLLRHALSATLNGVLDARGALATDTTWLPALLDVLAAARSDPTSGGDNFLIGLLRGRGYPLLVSQGLTRAAEILGADQANTFKQLAADLLKAAAPLVAQTQSFGNFFADHWGDLLRAGLAGLERQGPALLQNQPELLRNVLVGMVTTLKDIPQSELLSSETLFHLGDAAIAAVAAKPELLTAKVGDTPWLRALLESFVKTAGRDGLRLTFSQQGLDAIVTDAAGVFAAHPELLFDAANAGLVREIIGGILGAVIRLPSLDARNLATAAAGGTLRAIAANPALLGTRYAQLVTEFSGHLADLVAAHTLTGLDATAIVEVALSTLLNNPALFSAAQGNLATVALNAVLRAAGNDPARLLAGRALVETLREVLTALARSGRAKVQGLAAAAATDRLTEVIQGTLTQLAGELGQRVDLAGLPPVIGGLVAAWACGDLDKVDATDPTFSALFSLLLDQVAT